VSSFAFLANPYRKRGPSSGLQPLQASSFIFLPSSISIRSLLFFLAFGREYELLGCHKCRCWDQAALGNVEEDGYLGINYYTPITHSACHSCGASNDRDTLRSFHRQVIAHELQRSPDHAHVLLITADSVTSINYVKHLSFLNVGAPPSQNTRFKLRTTTARSRFMSLRRNGPSPSSTLLRQHPRQDRRRTL